RGKEELKAVPDSTVGKVQHMDPRLARTLNPQITTKSWHSLFKVSLAGEQNIPLNKRGSGVRRLILLGFFQAKSEDKREKMESPSVIYAIEEPETALHPDWQRKLLHTLMELSEDPDCQVIISTHTPMLGALLPASALRYVEIDPNGSRLIHAGDEETYRLVADALGVLPDNKVKLFVALEGIADIDFLKGMSGVLRREDPSVPDLGQMKEKGEIVFIPLGGSNLKVWANRLAHLNRPEFHLYDRDTGQQRRQQEAAASEVNSSSTLAEAHLTGKREAENYIHPDAIQAALGITVAFDDDDDVPALCAKAVHEESDSPRQWKDLDEERRRKKISRVKRRLNAEAVEAMTPELLDRIDPARDVRSWLRRIAELTS
ncbi:MAG: AAA family ATPase, partial [Candidatus Brocadiia bacterium]